MLIYIDFINQVLVTKEKPRKVNKLIQIQSLLTSKCQRSPHPTPTRNYRAKTKPHSSLLYYWEIYRNVSIDL